MTTKHEFHDVAERAREAFAPDEATLDRIASAVEQGAAVPSVHRPYVKRRRGWRGMAVVACAGATALGAAMALAPDENGESPLSLLPAPTSAEAFQQASAAAAGETWSRLGAGEYHHVYTLDIYVPQNPWSGSDEAYVDSEGTGGVGSARATESWISRDGTGRRVQLTGLMGSDPSEYPTLMRHKKKGHVQGLTWNTPTDGSLPVRERLENADQIDVFAWAGGETKPTQTQWYRQPEGYVPSRMPGWQGYVPTSAKGTTAERIQHMAWGNTIDYFDRLNGLSGAALDRDLQKLLGSGPIPGQSEFDLGDTYGATRVEVATEERIARAVRLLGDAPIAPHVRSAIFDWLSKQDAAKVQADYDDVLGRTGTRVTFKQRHRRTMPARTWTLDEVVERAKGDGQPVIGRLDADPTYAVPEYAEYRDWYVDVVFDEETGRLLQQANHVKWGTTGSIPRMEWSGQGAGRVTKVALRREEGVVGHGTAYMRVDRTTDFKPASAVCREHPEVCG